MPLLRDLKENNPDDFKNYLRMDKSTFEYILNLVRPYISKQDTVMRKSITADEYLVATLRFLATRRSYQDIQFFTCISAPSLCNIRPETCLAIYTTLKDKYLKFPRNKEEWLNIAEKFNQKWNFSNCGGALDRKHIRITQPPSTGAQYYNFKGFYSIVLMALVNADHEFLFVNIGKNGRLGGVIEYMEFYQRLKSKRLNLPTNDETKIN
ncbi:uncharacterized protein LOC126742038 [Anthonomus grandis grandis]|uniref:uncharacterized protein LOC126742038 n=1 Tax=Anthonomus grandis grandis TaxID=2921223 RepID=UPI00216623BF|nr:uncharacterized protein LOC126742038 [Anthonomus grandis grandis]